MLLCVCVCVLKQEELPLLGEEPLLSYPTGEKKVLLRVAFMQIGIR